jgi:hypothetical protein
MVYGELGRYPIDIDIKVRTISYWARLLNGKQAKFSNVFYRLSRNLKLHFCQIPRPRNHIRE